MRNLFVWLFFVLTVSAFAQKTIPNSFIVKDNKSSYTENFITTSITDSNLESYRLKNKRNTIIFENGFTIELLSAKELVVKGLINKPSGYVESFPVTVHKRIFNLLNSGIITIGIIENTHPKSSKK